MKTRIRACAFLLLCVLIMCTACKLGFTLVGKWEAEDGSSVTFSRDGTVIFEGGFLTIVGNYRVLDGHRLRVDLQGIWGLGGPAVYEYQISGDTLTLIGGPLSTVTEYTRVR